MAGLCTSRGRHASTSPILSQKSPAQNSCMYVQNIHVNVQNILLVPDLNVNKSPCMAVVMRELDSCLSLDHERMV